VFYVKSLQVYIEQNPTIGPDGLNSFLASVASTDRDKWTAIWDAIDPSQRVSVLRWVKRTMVEYLEGYEELAVSVHNSFSKDSDPLVMQELKTPEYRIAIRRPAERGLSTKGEKLRQDRLIAASWGDDWKEHAQPCLFPLSHYNAELICPRFRARFIRNGQTWLEQVEKDFTAPCIQIRNEVRPRAVTPRDERTD
jgi:hypothetical protein